MRCVELIRLASSSWKAEVAGSMIRTIAIEFNKPLLEVVLSCPGAEISGPAQAAASKEGSVAAQTQTINAHDTRVQDEPGDQVQQQLLADLRQSTELIDRLLVALEELEGRRQQSLVELQQVAVELAIRVAEALTMTKIARDEFSVDKLVKEAVAQLGLDGPIRVYLNPTDLAILSRRLSVNPEWLGKNPRIEFVSSSEVKRGDCLAEAGEKMISSHLELRLEQIRQDLLDGLEHAQVERRRSVASDRLLGRFPDRRQTA